MTNKPAFPVQGFSFDHKGETLCYKPEPGITIREHYAGLAMQGMLGGDYEEGAHWRHDSTYDTFAENAVCMADALIAELEKEA